MSATTYLLRVRGLLAQVSHVLTAAEKAEVHHLLDHDEPVEALRTLAWIVADGKKPISRLTVSAIRELAAGAVDEADMPTDLDAHAID